MKLSVLVPVYSKESPRFLRASLYSLATQTRPADEIVIIEDGPLGAELDTAIACFRETLPIVAVRLPANSGLGTALQAGVRMCRGEYVARMDSDNVCVAHRLEEQLAFLEREPEVDVLGAAIAEFEEDVSTPHSIRRMPEEGEALLRLAKFRNPLNHMTVMFRRASVLGAGNFQPCAGFEDYHLWARMLTLGYRLHNLSEVLVFARCGNGMQGRRGGIAYLQQEIKTQLLLHRMGLLDARECIRNIMLRAPVRLAPRRVRSMFYSIFLRERCVSVQRTLG